MTKNSKFRKAYERREVRLNLGFKYKDSVLKRTISSQMYGINEVFDEFLKRVNDIMYENIEAVKRIKVWANIAIEKHSNKLN